MADQAAAAAAPKGRPMKFPYTFSAKLAQFPYKYYFKNQWGFRYYIFAIVACIPVFKKIQDLGMCPCSRCVCGLAVSVFCFCLANSPENVAKWAEIRRKEASEHH